MRDITLEDTFRHPFTTRAFGTGVPTTLSGTPVLSVLEENNATPITSGVSVSVDRASVVGLNEATIVATAGNGYENGKSYGIYISTGTVGGVSVIGEVVGNFTIGLSAAAVDLANGTDGLTALKTGIDAIPTTAMRGTDNALLAASINLTAGAVDSVTLVATTTTNTDMRGTDSANTIAPDNAGISSNGTAIAALNDISVANIFAGGDIDGFTLEQAQKLILSSAAAKLSGAATTTIIIRAADDSKDRITATVDVNGNRSAVILDAGG